MKWKQISLACILAAAMALAPISSVFAQEEVDPMATIISTSTTVLTTAGIVGGIILTVMMVSNSSSDMENYMRNNAVALQHDLYMGGGETAQDLAGIFHVPDENLNDFANILFQNRNALAPLAEPGQINADSVEQFTEIIIDNMLRDRALATHIQSVLG